jgi:hypothetical protein
MPRLICRVLGFGFLAVGAIGFADPMFLGMHLTPVHNLIHVASGLLALYIGFAGSEDAVRAFSLVFGAVYAGLGVLGFLAPSLVGTLLGHGASLDAGALTPDNLVHLVLGGAFLAGLASTARRVPSVTH